MVVLKNSRTQIWFLAKMKFHFISKFQPFKIPGNSEFISRSSSLIHEIFSMAAEYLAPPYKDLLTCLLPEPDTSKPLYSRIEDTLFGTHVPPGDDSTSDLSGFLSSTSDASGPVSETDESPPLAPFNPSRFTWRNTVSCEFSRSVVVIVVYF